MKGIRCKILPQEGLKLIACLTMLIDHVGAVLIPSTMMRLIGRLSFPIYCFLLAQGAHHTKHPLRYLLRLGIVAVVAELPYDLLFYGRLTFAQQSVMVTLVLGLSMALLLQRLQKYSLKLLVVVLFCAAADVLRASYGGWGIAMVALFVLTEGLQYKRLLQLVGLVFINWYIPSVTVTYMGITVPLQVCGAAAIVPIAMYSGKKLSASKSLQWGFYVFYPAHLALLWLLCRI